MSLPSVRIGHIRSPTRAYPSAIEWWVGYGAVCPDYCTSNGSIPVLAEVLASWVAAGHVVEILGEHPKTEDEISDALRLAKAEAIAEVQADPRLPGVVLPQPSPTGLRNGAFKEEV